MTKVAFISGPISPYQARLFNGLAKHIDVTVYRNLPESPFAQWTVPEPEHVVVDLPVLWKHGVEVINRQTVKLLSGNDYSSVVACGHHLPAFWAVSSRRLECDNRILWTEQPEIPLLDWPPRAIKSKTLRKPLREFALRMTTRRLDQIWAIGTGCADYFAKRVSVPTEIVTYFADIEPAPSSNRDASQVEVAFIGQLSKRKGALAIKPFYEALVRRYGNEFRLTIAGSGPLEAEVRSSLTDTPNVTFLGHVDHDEVVRILGRTDIFLAPAIHDGWGLHVVEALSQGCFVIGSNQTSSAKTCVTDDAIGLLVDYSEAIDPAILDALPDLATLRQGFAPRVDASRPYLLTAGIERVATLLRP